MNQKYYQLRQPSKAKIVGVKDGGSQAEFIKDGFKNKELFDEILAFSTSSRLLKFPKFELNLEYVKMRNNAKLTDFISFYPHIVSGTFLVSEKVVKILSTFNLPKHKYYPASIDFKGEIINTYKLLYIPFIELLDVINVSKSTFLLVGLKKTLSF
ncbi:MAG: hypothetical protein O9353_11965 [Bacteroidia bacterium]|nr:hypothetical protein [Bacteroidia bacterium]